MPIFWLEQKFILDADTAGQLKLALNAPFLGQIIGALMMLIGLVFLFISQFRKLFCAKEKAKSFLSKLEANGTSVVIIDSEINPLVNKG